MYRHRQEWAQDKENIQHDTTQNTKKMSVCEQRYSRKWAITVSYKIK